LRPVHYITLAAAIALTALLYLGGNTVPPAKDGVATKQQHNDAAGAQGPNTMRAASFDSIIISSRKQLPKTAADEIAAIENKLAAIRDSSQMAAVFIQLAQVWEKNKQLPVAAYYSAKAAKLENSEKKLTFAGQFFLQLMQDADSRPVQMWEAEEAISCFQQSLALDTNSEDIKLGLATGYIEGTNEPMRGVQMLLAITRDKPDDIPANLLLGKMSVQSGQYDKAIDRFEKVLKIEPNNTEAMYFMAEAYKGKGEKQKAIDLLEKCKRLVNKPEFSRDVDQYINSFK